MASPKNSTSSSPDSASFLWHGSGFEAADSVPLTDRGFRYGLALFETLRVRNGRAEFVEAHLNRLRSDAASAGFQTPPAIEAEQLQALVPSDFTGVLRIHWTAGIGAPTDSWTRNDGRFFVTLTPREYRRTDFEIDLSPAPVATLGYKTQNYWQNLAALQLAQARGFNETVLWNWAGNLQERTPEPIVSGVCLGNLFWQKDGRWRTPGQEARQGVVREWILRHLDVEVCNASPQELTGAEEIFLSNSWIGISGVRRFQGRELEITRQVAELAEFYDQSDRSDKRELRT